MRMLTLVFVFQITFQAGKEMFVGLYDAAMAVIGVKIRSGDN